VIEGISSGTKSCSKAEKVAEAKAQSIKRMI
jgi:hypothetical protein